jgi:hypothetical protein
MPSAGLPAKLVNVLARQREAEPIFARLGQNRGKSIRREILKFVNEQVKVLALGFGQFEKQVAAGKIPKGTILVVENLDRLSRTEISRVAGLASSAYVLPAVLDHREPLCGDLEARTIPDRWPRGMGLQRVAGSHQKLPAVQSHGSGQVQPGHGAITSI